MFYSQLNKPRAKVKGENSISVKRNVRLTVMRHSSVREKDRYEDEACIGSTIVQRHNAWQGRKGSYIYALSWYSIPKHEEYEQKVSITTHLQ